MKENIKKSAKEIIPSEYSHLFGKKDEKPIFKPKKGKKQHVIRKKIYKIGYLDEFDKSFLPSESLFKG